MAVIKAISPMLESPCKGVCNYDPIINRCKTCNRAIEQITAWSGLTSEQRRDIVKQNAVKRHKTKEE
jgi:predicted Fe-S protein YdhL (DUF1289 family)